MLLFNEAYRDDISSIGNPSMRTDIEGDVEIQRTLAQLHQKNKFGFSQVKDLKDNRET